MARRREGNLGRVGEIQEATERVLGPRQPRVGEQLRRVDGRLRRRYAELGLCDTRRCSRVCGAPCPSEGDRAGCRCRYRSVRKHPARAWLRRPRGDRHLRAYAREGRRKGCLPQPAPHGVRRAPGFEAGSFSAAVSVGVFTTNHAPPEALDELVRVVEPEGWVIFSVRDDVYRKDGFEEKQASLEKVGRWRRVTMSEAFQPFPAGNTSHMSRLFVYKTG